ncbi:MAG: RNA polymerase sigma factor [Rubripirellula sp.]|jgi:RNA polymerase sigma-70 factor (ECF subfamily)
MTPDPALPADEDLSAETATEGIARRRRVFNDTKVGLRFFLSKRLPQEADIDDCLQVVFVKLMEKGDGVAPPALRSWLYRVASNESARLWRTKAAAEKMYQKHGGVGIPVPDPTMTAMQAEATEELKKALKELPESWQQIVSLRIYENLTFQQIANQLGIPLGTALTRMRRALERLKNDLSK